MSLGRGWLEPRVGHAREPAPLAGASRTDVGYSATRLPESRQRIHGDDESSVAG
jgi:hypothetical protein